MTKCQNLNLDIVEPKLLRDLLIEESLSRPGILIGLAGQLLHHHKDIDATSLGPRWENISKPITFTPNGHLQLIRQHNNLDNRIGGQPV